MAGILAIDPAWDLVTRYLQAFRNKFIYRDFNNTWPNHNLHLLQGNQAVQPGVDNFLNFNSIEYITASGHGLYDNFTGHSNSTIWSASQPLCSKLSGTIIHLVSCQTGGILGRTMVKRGVRAFWDTLLTSVLSIAALPLQT